MSELMRGGLGISDRWRVSGRRVADGTSEQWRLPAVQAEESVFPQFRQKRASSRSSGRREG